MDLNWEKSPKIVMSTAKGRLTTLTNKRIPLQTKAMVINCVILKAVEYTLNFAHLSDGESKELNKCIAKCIKYSIPMHARTASDFVWRPVEEGGCGITETNTLMNTATLSTAFNCILVDKNSIAFKPRRQG